MRNLYTVTSLILLVSINSVIYQNNYQQIKEEIPIKKLSLSENKNIELVIAKSLENQRTNLNNIVIKAQNRIREFAKKNNWENLVQESFIDKVMIFDSKADFDKTLLEVTNSDPNIKLPLTYCAALENRILLVVSPQIYSEVYPEGIEEDSYEKLLAHEIAHRLHVRILDGNEEAMGPVWFFEGFALYAADQFNSSNFSLKSKEISEIIESPERGSYIKYAWIYRYFLNKASLKELIKKAGEQDFTQWLHKLENER